MLLIKLDNNEIELCDVALIASGLIIVEAIKVQPMHTNVCDEYNKKQKYISIEQK